MDEFKIQEHLEQIFFQCLFRNIFNNIEDKQTIKVMHNFNSECYNTWHGTVTNFYSIKEFIKNFQDNLKIWCNENKIPYSECQRIWSLHEHSEYPLVFDFLRKIETAWNNLLSSLQAYGINQGKDYPYFALFFQCTRIEYTLQINCGITGYIETKDIKENSCSNILLFSNDVNKEINVLDKLIQNVYASYKNYIRELIHGIIQEDELNYKFELKDTLHCVSTDIPNYIVIQPLEADNYYGHFIQLTEK